MATAEQISAIRQYGETLQYPDETAMLKDISGFLHREVDTLEEVSAREAQRVVDHLAAASARAAEEKTRRL